MTLHLYDSASQQLQPLRPVHEGQVRIYLCGATVQGSPHIGHLRSAIAFDTLIRWLRKNGLDVIYVRNITDIDDKILAKSAEAGEEWWAWAAKFEREFAAAYDALGLLPPTFEPRATGHITDQIALINRLIKRGHAYADGVGNVYFDVHSWAEYGALTRQDLTQVRTTEDESQIYVDTEAGKRDPRDFALWKAAKAHEPATAVWDSPWGRGRPGWHLECSAMSHRYLGETFDIHGGGIDLRFPHHENEQAQSRAAGWGFTNLWVHNAWVTMKGEKMSKSLGNSLIVSEILKDVPAPALRFALSTVHHRSAVEYSAQTLESAGAAWEKIAGFVARTQEAVGTFSEQDVADHSVPVAFAEALDDDLNVAGGMAVVYERMKAGNQALLEGDEGAARAAVLDVRAMMSIMGLDPQSSQWASTAEDGAKDQALDTLVSALINQRAQARADKNWAQADAIRDQLTAAGIVVEDGVDGARWHLA